jgi:hypothetical protein
MRLPTFTAEVSLYRGDATYTGFCTGENGSWTGLVAPQFSTVGLGTWWLWVPDLDCPPPFCGRDQHGHCHCLSVMSTM